MQDTDLINRLSSLPNFKGIPRQELEWLAGHGELEIHEAGTVIAPKDKRIDKLWIILSGRVAVKVDRGIGPRLVIEWHSGEVSGMLPYSRMTGPPGDNYLETKSELLSIHTKLFSEMIHRCPVFTTYTVHTMLDRARSFNASDLQDEKMISLGKLAAGLAHEINNPASAVVHSAKQMIKYLAEADNASRLLGKAALTDDMFDSIEKLRSACLMTTAATPLSPLEQAEREDEIADWLMRHNMDKTDSELLAYTPITINMLEELKNKLTSEILAKAIHWIAIYSATNLLAIDIEQAASRISDLVTAIKRFTYMDNLAGSELVEVEAGLRDTIKVLAAKSKSKNAAIMLDIQEKLPRVRVNGSDLNQVWMNLIDNALDAISDSGNIQISAYMERDRLVVRIIDDGHGIPDEIAAKIFDPFFTTKPPGQGTGLGLDITRRILYMYHGDITVQSNPERTEFRVSLIAEKSNLQK